MKVEGQIHPNFIALKYEQSRPPISPDLGNLALELAQHVIATTRNHLVFQGGSRACHPRSQDLGINWWAVSTLTCKVPATFKPQPAAFFYYNTDERSSLLRPSANLIAAKEIDAVRAILGRTPMRSQGEDGKQRWVSGPTPTTQKELRATVAGLPQLELPVPADASCFAHDLQAICSAIFDTITGGRLPHVTCQVSHKPYQELRP